MENERIIKKPAISTIKIVFIIISLIIFTFLLYILLNNNKNEYKENEDYILIKRSIYIGSIILIIANILNYVAEKNHSLYLKWPTVLRYTTLVTMYLVYVSWIYIALITENIPIFNGIINSDTFLFVLSVFGIIMSFYKTFRHMYENRIDRSKVAEMIEEDLNT